MKNLYEVLNKTNFNIEDYKKEELTDIEKKKLYSILGRKNTKKRFGRKFINIVALVAIMMTAVVFASGRFIKMDVLEPEPNEIAKYSITMETEGIELSKDITEKLLTFARNVNDESQGVLGKEYVRKMVSYNELEEYLGLKFIQSSILNKTFNPSALMYSEYEGGKGIIIDALSDGDKLLGVTILSHHSIPQNNIDVYLQISLRTPEGKKMWGDYQIKVVHIDHKDTSIRNVREEDYITKSGINAKIIHVEGTDRYNAYFEEDSIVYSLITSHEVKGLNSKELLIEVLESFER